MNSFKISSHPCLLYVHVIPPTAPIILVTLVFRVCISNLIVTVFATIAISANYSRMVFSYKVAIPFLASANSPPFPNENMVNS